MVKVIYILCLLHPPKVSSVLGQVRQSEKEKAEERNFKKILKGISSYNTVQKTFAYHQGMHINLYGVCRPKLDPRV